MPRMHWKLVVEWSNASDSRVVTMSAVHLSFVERKASLKWYWKYKNIKEVQRQWQSEFGTPPPTRRTIACIRKKFKVDGTVKDVHKERSGQTQTATSPAPSAAVLQHLVRSLQKSVNQGSHDSEVSRFDWLTPLSCDPCFTDFCSDRTKCCNTAALDAGLVVVCVRQDLPLWTSLTVPSASNLSRMHAIVQHVRGGVAKSLCHCHCISFMFFILPVPLQQSLAFNKR